MRLTDIYKPGELAEALLLLGGAPHRRIFPAASDRAAWRDVPEPLRKAWLSEAESYLQESWPSLTASAYRLFFTEGNREDYELPATARTGGLSAMLLAECLEGEGRFLPAIVDIVWLLCEQTAWSSPAHHMLSIHPDEPLPDPAEPLFDLSAGDTAAALCWTSHLLEEPLDRISPLIRRRIRQEVDRRILTPYLDREDFWWMGFQGREPNNWNPWCNSNLLVCVLLLEMEQERSLAALEKYAASLDTYLAVQYEDGGCDEGATYWMHAAGRLFANLDLLYRQSGGQLDLYAQPLIRRLGQFICKMHIDGDYYVNFADGAALAYPDYAMIARYGERIGDRDMMAFGSSRSRAEDIAGKSRHSVCLFHELCRLFDAAGEGAASGMIASAVGRAIAPSASGGTADGAENEAASGSTDIWLPDIQVLVARESEHPQRGLFIAAKGGHNDESHNHNDIGQWILYRNGQPVLIDIGVETYTRQTFGPERYSIWTMQSQYHNLPQVNGFGQRQGREYRAAEVRNESSADCVSFQLELAAAYPAEAGILRWNRRLDFRRGCAPGTDTRVTVTEAWELEQPPSELLLHYMTVHEPRLPEAGRLRLGPPSTGMILGYPAERLDCSWEEIILVDSRLQAVWGKRLFRIRLQVREPKRQDQLQLRFAPELKLAD